MIREAILNLRDLFAGGGGGGGAGQSVAIVLAIAVVLAIVIAAAVSLLSSGSKSGRVSRRLAERARSKPSTSRTGGWIWRLSLIAVVALTVAGASLYLGDNRTCLSCHKGHDQKSRFTQSVHREIDCVRCHQAPGVTGGLRQTVDMGRMFFIFVQARQVPKLSGFPTVDNASCLRCHRSTRRGVSTANGIRIRHSDILEDGARCGDCHGATAHPNSGVLATFPSMSACTTCHNGKIAGYECKMCHSRDVAANSDINAFAKVELVQSGQSCYRCHDEQPCTRCHGVKMPHSQNWMVGSYLPGHAYEGFKNRDMCFRCHYEGAPGVGSDKACSCHGLLGKQHGGRPWVREHGLQATGQKPGQFARCFDCHSTPLCEGCHPASYTQRYNPVTGDDQYQREIPLPPSYADY